MDEIIKLKKQVKLLQNDFHQLWEAVDLLASNCSCSVKERMSGHLVDCPMPKVREILDDDGPDESEV